LIVILARAAKAATCDANLGLARSGSQLTKKWAAEYAQDYFLFPRYAPVFGHGATVFGCSHDRQTKQTAALRHLHARRSAGIVETGMGLL
jgi:hypothetical protein